MNFFEKPEDLIISALSNRRYSVRLECYIGFLDSAFKKALAKEPRLCAFFAGYQANYMKKGMIQLMTDYDITLNYQEDAPNDLADVVLDNGSFDTNSILTPGVPKPMILVTEDSDDLLSRLKEQDSYMLSLYEGFYGFQINTYQFKELTQNVTVRLNYAYITDLGTLKMYRSKAVFSARGIWRKILGRARVPQFVKPFLALSYLMQTCYYDEMAYAQAKADPLAVPSDPVPHLAYGPLVEGRGVCTGIAWAFKQLMDEAQIPCICVCGYLKSRTEVRHLWNLVKIDGQYYHVDATNGMAQDGVFVAGLLKPDSEFAKTHDWDTSRYPKATGMRYQYDFIEDFLFEQGNDYLDDDADEKYMFPEHIVE